MNHINILNTLTAAGHRAFLVGGCVRDRLLGRQVHDYDITTSALPMEVCALFARTVEVGAAFGTIIVATDTGNYEVTTFRTEGAGRHPIVRYTADVQQDALRRDFTINAIYEAADGTVIDFHGGQQDLADKVIRCVGDPCSRLEEDPLRILRAMRFAAEFDFYIEYQTKTAVADLAPSLMQLSAERIRDELTKGLTGSNPKRFVNLLHAHRALFFILPELSDLRGCEQSPEHHPEGDVWTHTLLLLQPHDTPVLAWASLLHDIGKPQTKAQKLDAKGNVVGYSYHGHQKTELPRLILTRLKFDNAFIDTVCTLVENHMQHMSVRQMKNASFRKYVGHPTHELEMEIHRRDVMASNKDLSDYEYIKERQATLPPELPKPMVTGRDLISAGFLPGKEFKARLTAAYDAQLEGADKYEALRVAIAHNLKQVGNI